MIDAPYRPPLARQSRTGATAIAGDYRIFGYRLLMQFAGDVIEYFDHLASAVQARGRAARRTLPHG